MASARPRPISIDNAIAHLAFLADRTPTTTEEESVDAFAMLSDYRDGGIYVGHWAGNSEWERHPAGDEIVIALEGETTIFFRTDDGESSATLGPGTLVTVPQGTWHRLEAPVGAKLLSITPQPSDHQADLPTEA